MWALGIIAYALLSGTLPFAGTTPHETETLTVKAKVHFPKSIWERTSKDSRKFILACLQKEPENRPSAQDLCTHAWLVGHIPPSPMPLRTASSLLRSGGSLLHYSHRKSVHREKQE